MGVDATHATYEMRSEKPTLEFERHLDHPVDAVWAAITEPSELAEWFPSRVEVSGLRVGAEITFTFDHMPLDAPGTMPGRVTDFDPPRLFAFYWGEDHLRFELAPADEGTGCRLRFTVVLDSVDKASRDAAGWHQCLDALQQALGGQEVPRPFPSRPWRERYDEYVTAASPAGPRSPTRRPDLRIHSMDLDVGSARSGSSSELPLDCRAVPINTQAVGKAFPSSSYAVGREKIREYASAVGETNPLHFDVEAARAAGYADVVAPPMFAVVFTGRAVAPALFDPEVGLNFSMMVHGGQEFHWGPVVVAGDEITTTASVKDISERGGMAFYVFETVSENERGEIVCTGEWRHIVRGAS